MSNPEISCDNCRAVCCKGDPFLIMQLSDDELAFMQTSGNTFQTIETSVDYNRKDARYPIGGRIDQVRRTIRWIYEIGHETEPLPAGFGRYAMVGTCSNLMVTESGVEICGVYEARPQVCRDFAVASEKCVQLRQINGVEPA